MNRHLFISTILMIAVSVCFSQQYGSFKDSRDGKVYKTVKIGNQVWMTKNLDVSTFRNGDPIPQAKTDEEWIKAGKNGQPAWCYYNNDSKNSTNCGKLYNWFAVNDPRGLAPSGWRIPTESDWKRLETYLGNGFKENGWQANKPIALQLKNSFGWGSDGRTKDVNGNNSSGFSCNPCGMRAGNDGYFGGGPTSLESKYGFGLSSFIWFSTVVSSSPNGVSNNSAFGSFMSYDSNSSGGCTIFPKYHGASVRCIKDK
ncbi:MAG: hypothetical protein RL512_1320 [Bacteroidota bacterium]|jgi:uncharacterized protein (TIGR02145 family)